MSDNRKSLTDPMTAQEEKELIEALFGREVEYPQYRCGDCSSELMMKDNGQRFCPFCEYEDEEE